MIDPSLPLQSAVVKALEAALSDLVGDGVYDRVPVDAVEPYVALGADQTLPDYDQCHDGAECAIDVDVWSREPGRVEAKRIAAAAVLALDVPLNVEGFDVIIHEATGVRYLRDPDGLTTHAVISMTYRLQPSA